jgi:hypothetical protein
MQTKKEDDSDLVVVCGHLFRQGPDGCERPCQVIHVENGKLLTATCFECADAINATPDGQVPAIAESFRPLCPEHVWDRNIPAEVALADGFYEWHDGQWVKQLDSESAVN